jgi:hypothetical protein
MHIGGDKAVYGASGGVYMKHMFQSCIYMYYFQACCFTITVYNDAGIKKIFYKNVKQKMSKAKLNSNHGFAFIKNVIAQIAYLYD